MNLKRGRAPGGKEPRKVLGEEGRERHDPSVGPSEPLCELWFVSNIGCYVLYHLSHTPVQQSKHGRVGT
jgi:hypothetical protein